MSDDLDQDTLLNLTADVVCAYVSCNEMEPDALPAFMKSVYQSFSELSALESREGGANISPAVDVKDSVKDDHIICLEDGKKLKMLKRYLKTAYGMSPEDYRKRWGLPNDYPMVAPNYAKKRSKLAKDIGLGKR